MSSVFDERKEWLEHRGNGLGGTDISAVLNLNPWKNPLDVYLGKLGLTDRREPTEAMFWGNYMERGIAQQYAKLTGFTVVRSGHPAIAEMFQGRTRNWDGQTLISHADFPFVLGTPDAIVLGSSRGVEIKTSAFKGAEWGKPGTDEVPHHYRLQCAQYLAITGFDTWDLAALFSGNKLEIYTVGRDRSLEDVILNAAADFWHNHVEPKIPPPLDGSETWKRHLAAHYAIGNQTMIATTPELEQIAGLLRDASERRKKAEADEALAKNILAQTIGENKGVKLTDGGKVQWVRPRPSPETDWENAFLTLAASCVPGDVEHAIKDNTKEKPRGAYVRFYEGKKEE